MALFGKKSSPRTSPPPAPREPERDWSDIAAIRAEWPASSLNRNDDLANWSEGILLYQQDDYFSMMRCAALLSSAAAHSLYGEGILRGADLPDTVFKILYASLETPSDGRTFADNAQKSARLALTLIREYEWVPPSMGGTVSHFAPLLTDRGNYLLLCSAIGPAGRPWEGDVKRFMAVPRTALGPAAPPDSSAAAGAAAVDRVKDVFDGAGSGDEARELHASGMKLWLAGDRAGAQTALEGAANLGSVQAMKDAGDLAHELQSPGQARYWFERAATAGDTAAMWNLAVFAVQYGDLRTAEDWYRRCAEGGDAEGLAALTQLAADRGDDDAERRWARLGAEAGQTWCMGRHGLFLMMSAEGDVLRLRTARTFVEAAADRGDVDAMGLAVLVNSELGDDARGRRFVQLVVDSGDSTQIDRLRRFGILEG